MNCDSSVRGLTARDLDRRIRAYWEARVDDTRLSDHGRGTLGYFEALDAYRLEKSGYLLRLIDFAACAGRDVLDLGCGAGLDVVRFARAGAHVTAVDVAPTAIDLAREYCHAAGVDAHLVEADAARLPLPAGSFDFVCCLGLLPFVRDPVAIVAEAQRVLRPGGRALFMVYNRRSWMTGLARLGGGLGGHSDAPVFRLYDSSGLAELLSPFQALRLETERFPTSSRRHVGVAGAIFDCCVVPAVRSLPKSWLQPYGWHLLAHCQKHD